MLTNCEDIIEEKRGEFNAFLSVLVLAREPTW
jgi:hypothetical protein